MGLEVLARSHVDRASQVVCGSLHAGQLVKIPCSHITAEIQLPVFATAHGKSAARIEFSENGRISIRALRKSSLVISIALIGARGLRGLSYLYVSCGLNGSRFSRFLAHICTLRHSTNNRRLQQPRLRTSCRIPLRCRLHISSIRATLGLQARNTFLEALNESQHLLFAHSEGRPASKRN